MVVVITFSLEGSEFYRAYLNEIPSFEQELCLDCHLTRVQIRSDEASLVMFSCMGKVDLTSPLLV